MPTRSFQPRVTYANIVRDFEAAWNGIAISPGGDTGLGNFLFGFMGTRLLQWALVEANRKLIEVFEKKIYARLTEIWGDGKK